MKKKNKMESSRADAMQDKKMRIKENSGRDKAIDMKLMNSLGAKAGPMKRGRNKKAK